MLQLRHAVLLLHRSLHIHNATGKADRQRRAHVTINNTTQAKYTVGHLLHCSVCYCSSGILNINRHPLFIYCAGFLYLPQVRLDPLVFLGKALECTPVPLNHWR